MFKPKPVVEPISVTRKPSLISPHSSATTSFEIGFKKSINKRTNGRIERINRMANIYLSGEKKKKEKKNVERTNETSGTNESQDLPLSFMVQSKLVVCVVLCCCCVPWHVPLDTIIGTKYCTSTSFFIPLNICSAQCSNVAELTMSSVSSSEDWRVILAVAASISSNKPISLKHDWIIL